MRIYKEFTIESFGAWSGAVDTKRAIIDAGKADLFDQLVDDIFPDGCTETEMNDYLWFDSDSIFEMLGLDENGEEPDEDAPDLSGFADFETFCNSFGKICAGCPFEHIHGRECESLFDRAKEAATV